MSFEATLAAILNTTEKNALARAAGLQLLPVCNRCGGSGHYSYNQISGTTCFKCAGRGQVAPTKRQQKEVLQDAQAAVDSGKLDTYLADMATRARCKNALDQVMKAWKATGISQAYAWQNASASSPTFNLRDRDIADINAKMAAAYDTVQKAQGETFGKNVDKTAAFANLASVLDTALQTIAAAEVEFKSYLENN